MHHKQHTMNRLILFKHIIYSFGLIHVSRFFFALSHIPTTLSVCARASVCVCARVRLRGAADGDAHGHAD